MAVPATTGQLVTSLTGMNIGDYIPCTYTATTSGAVGAFSNLGVNTGTEIPITASATPNGLFYFMKVDKGLLIGDRVIQHSISWDVLNSKGVIEGKIENMTHKIPNTYSSTAGNASALFDNNLGNGWNTTAPVVINTLTMTYDIPINLKSYAMVGGVSSGRSPKNWTLTASNDNINWVTLDTRLNITWSNSELKKFAIANDKNYSVYKLDITSNNGDTILQVMELYMYIGNDILLRSLSGGCAYADANGNKSTTDQSKGAWPTINEWDTYIVNSNLKGKITKGDDNVWHWSGMYAWCQETPIVSIVANTYRVRRGNATVERFNTSSLSSSITTSLGFRPVLQYIESDGSTKQTTVWY